VNSASDRHDVVRNDRLGNYSYPSVPIRHTMTSQTSMTYSGQERMAWGAHHCSAASSSHQQSWKLDKLEPLCAVAALNAAFSAIATPCCMDH